MEAGGSNATNGSVAPLSGVELATEPAFIHGALFPPPHAYRGMASGTYERFAGQNSRSTSKPMSSMMEYPTCFVAGPNPCSFPGW